MNLDIPIPSDNKDEDESVKDDSASAESDTSEAPEITGAEQPGVVTTDSELITHSMGNAYEGQPNLDVDDPESDVYNGPETTVDKDYTYATYTDPARQRDPNGVYLDDVQRNEAEVVRAKIEGREPVLGKDAPAYGGDVIVRVDQAAKQLPGDYKIPVVKTLPVNVGVPVDESTEDSE